LSETSVVGITPGVKRANTTKQGSGEKKGEKIRQKKKPGLARMGQIEQLWERYYTGHQVHLGIMFQ